MSWKSLLLTAFILLGLFLAYRFYDHQFRLKNIQLHEPAEKTPSISLKDEKKLKELFSKPFYYLDRGKQSYVFVSRDGDYVLKFFDARCLMSGAMPLIAPISEKQCERKVKRLVKGYKVAQTYDKDNTGLIYVQLVPDPSYFLNIVVFDRFGAKHVINIAEVPFAVQLKAIPTRELITGLLKKGDVQSAKEHLRKIVDMYVMEYQRGVIDLDHNLMYNTGFVEEQPIRIDVGRLKYDENVKNPEVYRLDLQKVVIGRVGEWLGRHFPKYQQEIITDMQEKLSNL